MKNKPLKLEKNDTIGIICPAFRNKTLDSVNGAKEYLEKRGYKVKLGKSNFTSCGYLAGTDEERIQDIEEMFLDKDVRMILCMRGGYGASRIVDKINYDIIRENPKIFCGYSDITVLLNSIYQICKLPTIHGMVGFSLVSKNFTGITEEDFFKILTTNQKGRIIKEEIKTCEVLRDGVATGEIVGGNLSLLATTIASNYKADFKDKIIFIEEVDEEPYQLDRYFSALRLSGCLNEAKGFIFGYFTGCAPGKDKEGTQTYLDLIKEYFLPLNKPIIYNYPSGHDYPFINIPFGIEVKMDADKKEIEILEELYKER